MAKKRKLTTLGKYRKLVKLHKQAVEAMQVQREELSRRAGYYGALRYFSRKLHRAATDVPELAANYDINTLLQFTRTYTQEENTP